MRTVTYSSLQNSANNYRIILKSKVMILFIAMSFAVFSSAQAQVSTHKGQAIYIYSFTKYINWQSADTKLVIGILGKSPILSEIQNYNGKLVGGRELVIKQISNTEEAAECQIVYISTYQSRRIDDLIPLAEQKNILLITEDDLAHKGVGISFFLVDNKLKFKLNSTAVRQAGIKVSNDLLSIATII